MKVFVNAQIFFCILLLLFFCQSAHAIQGLETLDSEDLLISYTERSKLALSSDHHMSINVFRDGHVLIALPEAMKGGGYYRTILDQEKMDSLWKLMTEESILTFDARHLRKMLTSERRSLKESRAVVTSVSDKAEILIEYYPNRYKHAVLTGESDDVMRRIAWTDLRWDAEQYAHIEIIQMLSEIQHALLSILDRGDLQSVHP
ncbi:hypothetical protein SAMN05216326_104120 [Nitrosomonas marina]|uniref:Uncharacterized protein n=1 Tax=Nitrosomonas marina TaxID=917 RepID=A0A1H9ZMY4_9PROT|nr:hypothetical protein SAMN05216326_104120 [Nitrosomonas marina]